VINFLKGVGSLIGFQIVIAFTVVLLLAALGVAGYFFYDLFAKELISDGIKIILGD